MRLEELQAIWETQADRPVFAVNEFGLHLELYRTRERARRRLFWGAYFPGLVGSLVGLVILLVLFISFYLKNAAKDFPMNAWDTLAFLVAAGAVVLSASSMYARSKHERSRACSPRPCGRKSNAASPTSTSRSLRPRADTPGETPRSSVSPRYSSVGKPVF